jgi:phosphatidylserine decarboxylase
MATKSLKENALGQLLKVLPKNYLSYSVGKFASLRLPGPLNEAVIQWFAKRYKVSLSDAKKELSQYKSLSDFFTRELKEGIRPVGEGVVHPADSVISECGEIWEQTLVQAKGKTYDLTSLLKDPGLAARLEGGKYLTYYLCPTDYHRVHSPVDGTIARCSYIPGKLWPVNSWSVNNVNDLFPVNERLAIEINVRGKLAVAVMVGATNVGKMTVNFDSKICTNQLVGGEPMTSTYDPPKNIEKGGELGIFHMGSTVVMLYEKDLLPMKVVSLKGKRVQYGQSLS